MAILSHFSPLSHCSYCCSAVSAEHCWCQQKRVTVVSRSAGNPDSKRTFTRAKRWSYYPRHKCYGEWVRWICNVGLGDLPWIVSSPHMFVNKIRLEQDATAFRCLELWYRDRVQRQRHLANVNDTFDVSIYASQPFVRYHVWQMRGNFIRHACITLIQAQCMIHKKN